MHLRMTGMHNKLTSMVNLPVASSDLRGSTLISRSMRPSFCLVTSCCSYNCNALKAKETIIGTETTMEAFAVKDWSRAAPIPEKRPIPRFNSVAKFSPTKLSQTEFLTNRGINSYLFTEGALYFSPTKRNLLLILEIATLFNLGRYRYSYFLEGRYQLILNLRLGLVKQGSKSCKVVL